MIIYRDNFHLDESELSIDDLIMNITTDERCNSNADNHHSTYFLRNDMRHDKVYAGQYVDHMYDLLDDEWFPGAGIKINFWTQVYKGSGHNTHSHFRYNIPLSFVHFIRPSKKDCFHFVLGDRKEYPKQEAGDFIIFPSWAKHAIDPCPEDEYRVSIAGNIVINTFLGDSARYYYIPTTRRTDVVEISEFVKEDHNHDHDHSH